VQTFQILLSCVYLFNAQQELFEAFDLDNSARLLRFGAWGDVNVDDLSRVVDARCCQTAKSSFKLCCSIHSHILVYFIATCNQYLRPSVSMQVL